MRARKWDLFLPSTRDFLKRIYGTRDNYLSYSDPLTNPYRLLEEVCLLYENSFDNEQCAVLALNMLRIPPDTGPKYKCAHLYDVLTRILSSEEEIQKYLQPDEI